MPLDAAVRTLRDEIQRWQRPKEARDVPSLWPWIGLVPYVVSPGFKCPSQVPSMIVISEPLQPSQGAYEDPEMKLAGTISSRNTSQLCARCRSQRAGCTLKQLQQGAAAAELACFNRRHFPERLDVAKVSSYVLSCQIIR